MSDGSDARVELWRDWCDDPNPFRAALFAWKAHAEGRQGMLRWFERQVALDAAYDAQITSSLLQSAGEFDARNL